MGYFGSDTPEGRRHRNSCFAWLTVFMVTGVGAAIHSLPDPVRLLCAAAVPLSWVGIVWSTVRYFSKLDELCRLMQLEAAAFAYGTVIVLSALWYALWELGITAQLVTALHVNARATTAIMPILMLAVILLAEMLRGVTLALLARSRR